MNAPHRDPAATGPFCRLESFGQYAVLTLPIDMRVTADGRFRVEWQSLLAQLLESPARSVLVDLREADYFGSMILDALRGLWQQLQADGGELILCGVSPGGRDILQVARFDRIWRIAPSRDAALDDLNRRFPPPADGPRAE